MLGKAAERSRHSGAAGRSEESASPEVTRPVAESQGSDSVQHSDDKDDVEHFRYGGLPLLSLLHGQAHCAEIDDAV